MEKEQVIQQNEIATHLQIIQKTLIQMQEIVDDLPEDALPETDRLTNAAGCLKTALRSLRLIRENGETCHIVD